MLKAIFTILILSFGIGLMLFFVSQNKSTDITNTAPNKIITVVNKGEPKYKIALFADSHTSYKNLQKAVDISKNQGVDAIVHFGDITDFGEESGFSKSKEILDDSKIEYYVIAGDRDEVEDGVVFDKYFSGKECMDNLLKDYGILCLHNSFNYTLLSKDYLNEFYSHLANAKIIFAAQPLYNPKSLVYMGYYDEKVKKQADALVRAINDSSVKYVIAADAHFYSKTTDKATGIEHYTLGALTNERNLQDPNFAILYIYEDGGVEVNQIYL